MKIVYLIPGCGVSGGIAVICQHANRLMKRGHEVILVCESAERSIEWFPGQQVPVIGLDRYPADVDILVATGWSTSFPVAVFPARHKFYFVQSDETRFHPKNSPWEHIARLSYTFGYNYLTEASWIKDWLRDNFEQAAELVPNGLDETIFFPDVPLEPKGRKPRVLLEGAIGLPYKGMAEAFAAVQDLDVEVWCVSSYGKPKKGWKCDRFFEQIPMLEMRRVYSSCDILLKLSRVEGFFGPPMEMMACGGVVVVGEVTGHDEYIVDERNALVVDATQPHQAAQAIQRLITDSDLRARLVESGKQTAGRWRWEPSIDRLERYYEDVMAGHRGVPMTNGRLAVARSLVYFYEQTVGKQLGRVPSLEVPDASRQATLGSSLESNQDTRNHVCAESNRKAGLLRPRTLLSAVRRLACRIRRAGLVLWPYGLIVMRDPRLGFRMAKNGFSIIRESGWQGLKTTLMARDIERRLHHLGRGASQMELPVQRVGSNNCQGGTLEGRGE